MYALSAFQRDVLYVLAGLENPYGLAVKSELEAYYENDVNHGRLYPNLDELADRGYVEKGEIDRRTNSYELTDEGWQLLADRRQWETGVLENEERVAV